MASHEEVILRLLGLLPQALTRVGVHRTPTGAELGLANLQMVCWAPCCTATAAR